MIYEIHTMNVTKLSDIGHWVECQSLCSKYLLCYPGTETNYPTDLQYAEE